MAARDVVDNSSSMSDPHPGEVHRAPAAPSSSEPTAAEAEEEERDLGALARRKLPGDDLSKVAEARAFATSSMDFGFGNSWSHIPIPVGNDFDAHHHHSPPHHEGGGQHEPWSGGEASAGGYGPSRVAGRHSDDDKAMSDSQPRASVARSRNTSREAQPKPVAASAGAGALEPTLLGYAQDAGSTNPLAEVEPGERFHAHSSSVSGRIGVDAPHGAAAPAGDDTFRATTPTEQVSLPDDIYGAARVSEYWHGVPGLSSLASSYVYDDIWAGNGGLNPR